MNVFQIPARCKFGVKNLDDQHLELIDIIVSLNDHVGSGALPQAMAIFARFRQSLVDHFIDEEALMHETGYADVGAHSVHHQELLRETDRIYEMVRDRKRLITYDIDECVDKVLRHMLAADAPFNTHLHQIQYSESPSERQEQDNHATN